MSRDQVYEELAFFIRLQNMDLLPISPNKRQFLRLQNMDLLPISPHRRQFLCDKIVASQLYCRPKSSQKYIWEVLSFHLGQVKKYIASALTNF